MNVTKRQRVKSRRSSFTMSVLSWKHIKLVCPIFLTKSTRKDRFVSLRIARETRPWDRRTRQHAQHGTIVFIKITFPYIAKEKCIASLSRTKIRKGRLQYLRYSCCNVQRYTCQKGRRGLGGGRNDCEGQSSTSVGTPVFPSRKVISSWRVGGHAIASYMWKSLDGGASSKRTDPPHRT